MLSSFSSLLLPFTLCLSLIFSIKQNLLAVSNRRQNDECDRIKRFSRGVHRGGGGGVCSSLPMNPQFQVSFQNLRYALTACERSIPTVFHRLLRMRVAFNFHHASICKSDGACAHYVMVSKFQWKPFWLATQRDPQNDWTATQNRVNYDVFAQAPLSQSAQDRVARLGKRVTDGTCRHGSCALRAAQVISVQTSDHSFCLNSTFPLQSLSNKTRGIFTALL